MFELNFEVYGDNIANSRLCCDIYEKGRNIVVEFIQYNRSDLNKWQKPKVLTDLYVKKFILPESISEICSKGRLKSYIKNNLDADLTIVDKIEALAKSKQSISISLPTTIYSSYRGIKTGARGVKDSYLPLIVKLNGEDVSFNFMDFGEYGENIVEVAYRAMTKGCIPYTKNDLFYIDGVKSLHEQIVNSENEN